MTYYINGSHIYTIQSSRAGINKVGIVSGSSKGPAMPATMMLFLNL